MRPLRVWCNENLSSTYNFIRLLKGVPEEVRPFVVCTHRNPEFGAFEVSDLALLEPEGSLDPEAYLTHSLEFCRRHAIDVYMPGRGMKEAADARARFAAIGVGLILAADAGTIRHFDDKAAFYAALPPEVGEAPVFFNVNTVAAFSEACRTLTTAGHRVCFKPSKSTGGLGFHILDERHDEVRGLFHHEVVRLAPATAERILASRPDFRDLLVMEYLDGTEYSIDCLGHEGRLWRGIVRRKPTRAGGAQRIEDRPDLLELARRVAAHFSLGGIFNVQVRCAGDRPKVLEINPRMSGGLYFACLSGVNIPFWAVQMAAGRADESQIPPGRTGLRVQQQYHEFVLDHALTHGGAPVPA